MTVGALLRWLQLQDWQLGLTYGRGFVYEVGNDADGNSVLRNEVASVVS